ncbi:hypothetical protein FI667_g8801, partial [Globisporangium splendens]
MDDDDMKEALGIEYEQAEPHTLAFTPSDRTPQRVRILNRWNDLHVLFKVQCSVPSKLRIKPFLVPSHAASLRCGSSKTKTLLRVSQLNYEPREVECKLLIEMHTRYDGNERDLKTQWAVAAQHDRNPLCSETTTVRIKPGPPDENQAVVVPIMGSAASEQATPTIEQQADIVHLLMKNQSDLVENRLTSHEKRELQRLRVQFTDETQ